MIIIIITLPDEKIKGFEEKSTFFSKKIYVFRIIFVFSLLHTKTGGGGGGSSSLTKEGTVFLQNYLRAEEQLSAYASELFQEIFTGQKTPLKNLD